MAMDDQGGRPWPISGAGEFVYPVMVGFSSILPLMRRPVLVFPKLTLIFPNQPSAGLGNIIFIHSRAAHTHFSDLLKQL